MFRNIRPSIHLLCISVVVLCFGCHVSEFDSAEGLDSFILSPGSNLTLETETNGYSIRVTYRPTDLLVNQELSSGGFDSAKLALLRRKYNQYYYFILSLSKDSHEALQQVQGLPTEYSDLLATLSFRMANYVCLTTGSNDTIAADDYLLNRTFGLSQSTDLLFAFNRKKAIGKEWVQVNIQEFGLNVGSKTFRFSRKMLDEAPGIDFTSVSFTN